MKYIYLITFILFSFVFTNAQTTITGTVTDVRGTTLETASVILLGTTKGTVTDKRGTYTLLNIPNGTYTLEISYIGYADFTKVVTINDAILVVDAQLDDATQALQAVEIVGRKNTDYRADVTFAGTKTGADIKLIPQSIAILNKEIIADQGLFRLNEVTENVAGVTQTRAGDEFTSRGFRVTHDFINGNRALLGTQFSASTIATQYERIEFIKGPTAALFGNSSPGGVVNAVTKKPLRVSRADASLSYGSFETKRGTMDVTGPLNENKTLLYRMNFGWENAETFRDFQKSRSVLFAPSLSYLPSENTSFNIDIVGTFNNDTAGIDRGMPILQNDLFALPISFSSAEPYDNRQNSSVLLTVSGSHKFSDALSLNMSYTRSDFDQNFLETRSTNRFTDDGTELIRTINDRLTDGYSNFITAYLVGKFKTGKITHESVLGWDYYNTFEDSRTRAATGESNGVPNLVFDNRVPINSLVGLSVNFTDEQSGFFVTNQYRGFYAQDLIGIGRLKVLAGLRYENLDQQLLAGEGINLSGNVDNNVFLPRLGLTYELNGQVNLFASYTESFSPQNIPIGVNTIEEGQIFDPLTAQQYEIGTKTTFFNNRLLAQLSLYTIDRTGRLIEDPTIGGGLVQLLQIGDETSKGLELDITGRISKNFTLTANYAYNQVEVQDDDFGSVQLELENNNPQHTAGFWGKYTISDGFFENVGIGLGGRYVGSSRIPDGSPNSINEFVNFDSYQTVRAGLFYKYNTIDLTLNVNNLFDERYFVGGLNSSRVFPGAPRNFLFTVGYSF
ncbi:MAG: TonB-dependent receptor [Saonia sp.]